MKKLFITTFLLASVLAATDAFARDNDRRFNDNNNEWDRVESPYERRNDRWDNDRWDHDRWHRNRGECFNDRAIQHAAYDFDRAVDDFRHVVMRGRRARRLMDEVRRLSFESTKFMRMADRRINCRGIRNAFRNVEFAFRDLQRELPRNGFGRGFLGREFQDLAREFRQLERAVEGGRNFPRPRPRPRPRF